MKQRLAVLFSALALGGLGFAVSIPRIDRPSVPPAGVPEDAPAAVPAVARAPGLTTLDASLGRRGTLGDALDRLSVPADLRAPLLAAIGSRIDARRLSPQTAIRALVDEHGAWRVVGVRAEPERFLRIEVAENDGARLASEWIDLPTETELRAVTGIVESSVAQSLAHHPHGDSLTLGFADIFQWDVDLLVDPRPGDRVHLVYELQRLGQVPDATPPLRGRADRAGDVLGPGRIVAASYTGRVASADAFWIGGGPGADGSYYDRAARPLRKTFLKSPLNYRRISSGFSRARKHPVTRQVVPHHGVDYAAAAGTPVVASADGRVVSAGWDGPLGRALRIRHGSEFVTVYGHLLSFARGVRVGTQVRQNQVIGYVGSTGRATGPHLHYTVIRRGAPIDPLRMENPPATPLDARYRPDLARAISRYARLLGVERTGSTELARRVAVTEAAPGRSGS